MSPDGSTRHGGNPMKFIVTGFNAFGEFAENPSEQTVQALPGFVKLDDIEKSAGVAKLTLTTCCSSSWQELKRAVDDLHGNHPQERFAIVMCGVAGGRDKICLERFALNVRQYRIPDNNEHQPHEEHIDPQAPDALRTKLPLKPIVEDLNRAGYACDISNYAGTYVCNDSYFRALLEYNNEESCAGVIFVHVPPFNEYKHSNPEHKDARSTPEIYKAAMVKLLEIIASIESRR